MKRQIKKAAALCTALALLAGSAACGQDEPVVQIIDDLEAQPEYLSFFSSASLSGSDVGKYWSERFNETYNKKVYVDYDGASYYAEEGLSYRELLEKRLQSSNPDDLYIINAEDVIDFGKKGYWMDLSDMDFVDNLSEAALYQSTYDGKVFSVPLSFTGFGLYWNVDLLGAHGLTVPENLEQFLSVCETLKANGLLPYGANKGFALTVPAMCSGLAPLYQSPEQERLIAALNSGETAISTYLRAGFTLLRQMIDNGYLDPQQALDTVPGDEWELFLAGRYAFICGGLGVVPQQTETLGFQLEMTGLPVLADGSIAVYGADSRLCVNPNATHLETALEFIEMVGTPEALNLSAELDNTISSAKDGWAVPSSVAEKMCTLLQSPNQIPNQDFALHFNTWENIRNVGREVCAGASVEQACAMLDELQRAELASYAGR